ncbi:MAG: flagellar basal body P-ring protein FlgI, partial [Myxococcales bacterium]
MATTFVRNDVVTLSLHDADFRTAQRVAMAIDRAFGTGAATALDGGTITVRAPVALKGKSVELVAHLNDIEVEPATTAKVIINERTGTIVAGGDVRLLPVAISHGGITIVIKESSQVSQPNPLGGGGTAVTPQTDIQVTEGNPLTPTMTYLKGATSLADVAQAFSSLGVTPRELTSILQALRAAGA